MSSIGKRVEPGVFEVCQKGLSSVIERTGLEGAIRTATDPVALMHPVADEVMAVVGGAEGVLVAFVHDPSVVDHRVRLGLLEGTDRLHGTSG